MNCPPTNDFVVIVNRAEVDRPCDHVWSCIGGFFDLNLFLDVTCQAVSGDGRVGSARRIGATIIEAMVGASQHSYTYVQTEGSMSSFTYHGSVGCEPCGSNATEIIYTLFYDQAKIASDRRGSENARLNRRFADVVDAMKKVAEV